MRQLVLVLGAGGQLGEAIVDGFAPGHEVVARTRRELDVTAADAVRTTILSVCPDVIINCAAYTDVDGAETAPALALATNTWAVRSISRAAVDIDATLVHYSTDFVFDGTLGRPCGEDDDPNPRSVYAMTKLVGEWLAAEAPRHYVLRVESLFGGQTTKSSVDRLLANLLAGREVQAFTDRTVSPSYVEDVVRATAALIRDRHPYGLYHCVNTGSTTWLELARELAALVGRPEAPIVGVEMASSGLKALRPRFAALANAKLAAVGVQMPTWQDALARYVRSVVGKA